MKARKWISLLLAGAAVSLLAGCGNSAESSQAATTAAATTAEATTAAETAEAATEAGTAGEAQSQEAGTGEASTAAESGDAAAGSGNVLVVYYSATGNTAEVANAIAAATGGDLFELEPVEPYTSDDLNWTDENSRVSVEHENEDQRDVELVSTTVENWDSYDTVFILLSYLVGHCRLAGGRLCGSQ